MLSILKKINAIPGDAADYDAQIKKIIVAKDNTLQGKQLGSSAMMTYVLDHIAESDGRALNNLLNVLNEIMPKVYENTNTRNKYMSSIRTKIADKYGLNSPQYKEANDRMKITKDEKKAIVEKYNMTVKEKGRNRKRFIVEDIIKVINEAIAKPHWADQSIALLLVCGARPYELLAKNTYEQGETEEWIRISNLAKKRGDKQADVAIRPLIQMSAPEFIKRVNDLRELAKEQVASLLNKEGTELSKNVANTLNNHLREYAPFANESVSILRKIYGNLSYELYADKLQYNLNTWLSDVLGHDKADVSTASAYAVVSVNANGEHGDIRQVMAKLAEVKADNQVIKNDINELKEDVREHDQYIARVPLAHYDIEKIPKKMGRTDAEMKELMKDKMTEMLQKGVDLTNANVRKYAGVGALIVNKYFKTLKDDIEKAN